MRIVLHCEDVPTADQVIGLADFSRPESLLLMPSETCALPGEFADVEAGEEVCGAAECVLGPIRSRSITRAD